MASCTAGKCAETQCAEPQVDAIGDLSWELSPFPQLSVVVCSATRAEGRNPQDQPTLASKRITSWTSKNQL